MRILKLKVFTFIDEVIAYKNRLRFEIASAQQAIDVLFTSLFRDNERFVNYTSRIKEDESLKEKIIRNNYANRFDSPTAMFDYMSDIIGCRLECRFVDDEHVIYEKLLQYFPTPMPGGYFRSDRDPRIELRLSEEQPLMEKNGFRSYRIDGRYLGNRALNFELQIKSIVNLFWNEIDHKILYKNYNYVVSEAFVREIMNSIRGSLSVIDKQMQMVYDHLKKLENISLHAPHEQIRSIVSRLLQDAFIVKLREEDGLILDFRKPMDLITDFLFAKVRYESRERYAEEFVRLMDEAARVDYRTFGFGESIEFEHPIDYHNPETERIGKRLERAMNEGLVWNTLVRIVLGIHDEVPKESEFRTFVDYLYFLIIHGVRVTIREELGISDSYEEMTNALTEVVIDSLEERFVPELFAPQGIQRLRDLIARKVLPGAKGTKDACKRLRNLLKRGIPKGELYEIFD